MKITGQYQNMGKGKFSIFVSILVLVTVAILSSQNISVTAQQQPRRNPASGDFNLPKIDTTIKPSEGVTVRDVFSGQNTTAIAINDNTAASPYPTTITVSGLTSSITDINVTLMGLSHTLIQDVDVLLVGPGGQNLQILGDGASGSTTDVTVTFDDQAAYYIPPNFPINSGTYKPKDVDEVVPGGDDCDPLDDDFLPPAPAASANISFIEAFGGLSDADVNGDWSLYIMDDCGSAVGVLSGGWSMIIVTGTDATLTPLPSQTNTPGGPIETETSTPTPTDTVPSNTETATPTSSGTLPSGTSTSTATATATPVLNTELIVNGGFEVDENADKVPDGWTAKNAKKDKRKCNGDNVVAYEGECAYQFNSYPVGSSKLQQIVDESVVAPLEVNAGDTLILSGAIFAKGSQINTMVKVAVKYADSALPSGKIKYSVTGPTGGYVVFPNTLTLLLAGDPTKIKVMLKNSGKAGRVRYDALSLQLDNDASPLIPLPLP
jgi:subtilisin-like proprotein convertase family protein